MLFGERGGHGSGDRIWVDPGDKIQCHGVSLALAREKARYPTGLVDSFIPSRRREGELDMHAQLEYIHTYRTYVRLEAKQGSKNCIRGYIVMMNE